MPSGSDLVVLFGPAMVGTFEQLGVHALDPSGMFQGAVGRTSPVSSRDLRLASTAGQPREIPFSMSVFGRFAWVTVSRTMSSWDSIRKVTTDGPFGRWSSESSNVITSRVGGSASSTFDQLVRECESDGVWVASGNEWFPAEPTGPYLRLNFTGANPAGYPDAARTITEALARQS